MCGGVGNLAGFGRVAVSPTAAEAAEKYLCLEIP